MNTKAQILAELEQLPESMLNQVLEFARSLQSQEEQDLEERIWRTYLQSEREREEVYRRLADS